MRDRRLSHWRLGSEFLGFAGAIALGFLVAVAGMAGLLTVSGWQPTPDSAAWNALHPLRLGVNVTGITHYGHADLFPAATEEDVDSDLAALQRMGVSLVRVIVAFDGISAGQAADRLDRFLSRAEQRHISTIASFINYYGSRQNPPGLDRYYGDSWRGIPHLNHEFMASAYRGEYMDFVRTVVQRNRSHSGIYAWEPGNELQDADRQAFLRFMQDVSAEIKALDPDHPISSGVIEAAQTGFTSGELYVQLPEIDIVTIHPGNGYRGSAGDVDWAAAHGKIAIVEETGFSSTGDRTAHFQQEIDFWRSRGVSGFMLDGFLAKGLHDNGNGDRLLGFDAIWHTDYDGLANLVRHTGV